MSLPPSRHDGSETRSPEADDEDGEEDSTPLGPEIEPIDDPRTEELCSQIDILCTL